MSDRLAVLPQYLLPKKLVTQLAGRFASAELDGVTQAAYQHAKLEQGVGNGNLKNKRWVISATVPVTAKIAVIGEYAQAKMERNNNLSDNKDKAFTLAATYSLSKRTTAYAAFVMQDFNNSQYNGSNVAVNGVPAGTANRLDANIYGVGLRHTF